MKPIRGVITQWVLENNCIRGLEVVSQESLTHNSIVTSEVIRIYSPYRGIIMCETKNSRYILT